MCRFFLLLALLPVGVTGHPGGFAGPQDGEDPVERAAGHAADGGEDSGHARMLRELADLHARTPRENSYLGDRRLKKLAAEIAAAPESMPTKTLARLHFEVARLELRRGLVREAVERMLRVEELLSRFGPDQQPPFAAALSYEIAVAYLRLAENENCVARHTSQSCLLPVEGDGVHVEQAPSREAMRRLREVLAWAPPDGDLGLSARWLLNVAAMTVGEYPDGLSEDERIDPAVFESEADFPRFLDVAPELGLNRFDLCGGAVADDFDGDGFFDLLTSSWGTGDDLAFFRNAGDGTFVDASQSAGLIGLTGGLNLLQADYDGDGHLDFLVLRGAWLFGRMGRHPNSLVRNEGGARFRDVTFEAGLGEERYPTQTAGWADYDLDGDLDLFVGNEATPTDRFPCQLFRNGGDGTFTDVAEAAGVENFRYTKGVSWGDQNEDRYPDLYVSNLGSPNLLYRNQGDGTFVDVAADLKVAFPLNSFPAWFWDFDNDGALDIYVSSYDQGRQDADLRLAPAVASLLGARQRGEKPALYRADGAGGFTNVAAELGVDRISLPMGANFGDLDDDGWLDFYLGTGYPGFDGLIPNVLYKNLGGRGFADVTTAGGFGHLQKGHGVAFCDFDQDGDQDLFEQMGGAYPGDAFGNVLFENPGFGRHSVTVRLIGVEENRSAIGARLSVEFTDGEETRTVHRWIGSGGSFGCNPLAEHVGLGAAERVDRLEVYWPRADRTQVFRDLPADRILVITEGDEEPRVLERTPLELGG